MGARRKDCLMMHAVTFLERNEELAEKTGDGWVAFVLVKPF